MRGPAAGVRSRPARRGLGELDQGLEPVTAIRNYLGRQRFSVWRAPPGAVVPGHESCVAAIGFVGTTGSRVD